MIQGIESKLMDKERHFFEYGGQRSDSFDLHISATNTEASPEQDISFISIPGRDGELTQDNKRLSSFNKPIYVTIQSDINIEEAAHNINQWLKTDVRYKELNKSWDPDYTYKAIIYDYFDIQDILPKFGRVPLPFRWHPLKYRNTGLEEVIISNGDKLTNPELRKSKPIIHIEGTGDITLQLNGNDWCLLRSVDQEIIIDSEMETALKGNRAQNNKLLDAEQTDLFPLLLPGENVITWTGNVQSIKIIPRWEAIAT